MSKKLVVIDDIGSFSLVPYLKDFFDGEIYSMKEVHSRKTWDILKGVEPDIIFVDFCNLNAVNVARIKKNEFEKKPRVVVRLHGYEAQSSFMTDIDWPQIDSLIVVSPKFEEIVKSKIGDAVDIHIVPNGIDLEKFELQKVEDMDDNKVSYAGFFNKKKGPTLLRTVMASWLDKSFYVAGKHQDEQVRLYLDDINLSNVKYEGWVKTEEFFKGKRFVISTSVTESFGMSIAEGMAMGLTPLIHAWPGADKIWPKECIWTTFDELKSIEPKDPSFCRDWILNRYSMGRCIDKVMELLTGVKL